MGSIAPSDRSIDRTLFARLSLAAASISARTHPCDRGATSLGGVDDPRRWIVATAIVQVSWAAPASVRLDARTLDVGVAVNGAVVAAWIASRTIGLPFGPHAWVAEPVGAVAATATVLELLIVIGSTLLRVPQPDRGDEPAIASEA